MSELTLTEVLNEVKAYCDIRADKGGGLNLTFGDRSLTDFANHIYKLGQQSRVDGGAVDNCLGCRGGSVHHTCGASLVDALIAFVSNSSVQANFPDECEAAEIALQEQEKS